MSSYYMACPLLMEAVFTMDGIKEMAMAGAKSAFFKLHLSLLSKFRNQLRWL
jgi:hypothetical protein